AQVPEDLYFCFPDARCPVPKVENGRIVSPRTSYTHKDNITFECEPGYVLHGHKVVQCQLNDTWAPAVPVCQQGKCSITTPKDHPS
ncbi:CR2 protein, partial [Turnix velox]|nr:CR2 protein [Turnix velox]